MPDEFTHDVFISHSAKDKAVVRPLAERLQLTVRLQLCVWHDEREIPPDFDIPNWKIKPNRS